MNRTAEVLEAAYSELPERQAAALRLRAEQRLTYREIATELHTTPNAVDCLLRRARGYLKTALMQTNDQ